MADLDEIKSLAEAGNKMLHDLRAEVEAKANSADVVHKDELTKARADFAAHLAAEQKAALARLDALETRMNRPGKASDAGQSTEEKGFWDFIRGKITDGEYKAMSTNAAVDGGFLVIPTMVDGVRARLRRSSPIRTVAAVYTASTLEMLMERGDAGAEWAGETSARNETANNTIHKISIPTHELSALPKVSQRMLDDAGFDAGNWLTDRIADKFGRAEATAFVSGNGVTQPKGLTSYSFAATADASRADQTMEYVATGASGALNSTNPGDVFVTVSYKLQAEYLANASWLMKPDTAAVVATIKDANGYLVRDLMNSDGTFARMLQGRPVVLADDMPAIATNSFSVALGDFSRGYAIVDNGGFTILRDPYSAKPFVLFYATKRVGGGVTDFDAIKWVRFGSS